MGAWGYRVVEEFGERGNGWGLRGGHLPVESRYNSWNLNSCFETRLVWGQNPREREWTVCIEAEGAGEM